MNRSSQAFNTNVFVNCPFDDEYRPIFNAIVFTIEVAGFQTRSSLEASNAATNRLEKIMNIISECKYGIHDLSRIEMNRRRLPRFNMPLELGIDLGAERYGNSRLQTKTLLVMDKTPYRYQQFISDISGQDVQAHRGSVKLAITLVRDWLACETRHSSIPGGNHIHNRYRTFCSELPVLCETLKTIPNELTFSDFIPLINGWLEVNEQ